MMATYDTDIPETEEGMPSPEEINEMMVAKAHELFALCDKEQKVNNVKFLFNFGSLEYCGVQGWKL